MKILCVWLYEYNAISYEQVQYFEALEDLGHKVKVLPLEDISDGVLLDIVKIWKPELAIFKLYPDKIRLETIAYITTKTNTTTLTINGDDEKQFDTSFNAAPNYDYIVTTCKDAVKLYDKHGFKNVIFSQYGCNHRYCRKLKAKKEIDVSFLGSIRNNRIMLMDYLKINKVNIRVYGRGWETRGLNSDEYILATNQSRINLNSQVDMVEDKEILQIKGRDFEVPMCGSFLLTNYNENLKEYFKFGKEIETYKDLPECLSKIRYYLKHDNTREKIALSGYNRARKDHTYIKRFRNILKQVSLKC